MRESEPTLRIRAATDTDYGRLQQVFDEVEEFHREALPTIFRKPETTFPSQGMFTSLVHDSGAEVLITEGEKSVLGFLIIREARSPDDPILMPRRYATIDMLAVRRDYQRNGIGSRLVDAAHAWARGRGLGEAELEVWEFNDQARAFYEHMAYRTLSLRLTRRL